MTTEFFRARPEWTVAQGLEAIRTGSAAMETVYSLYIVDSEGVLIRAISLRELVTADRQSPILSVGKGRKPFSVTPDAPREKVARLISKYDLSAVPVLDESGKILGIVTVDDVIDAIIDTDTEDAQKLGGMEALDAPYMAMSFLAMIKKRAGWLCVLFLSEMLTASAMQHFESELEKAVVLTLFIPLIMSSGGNSGSQATSLIIRALALDELKLGDWWRVALREIAVRPRARRDPRRDRLHPHRALAEARHFRLWRALAAGRPDGRRGAGRHRHLRLARRLDAALHPANDWFDPASASAPFVATLVDVTGLVIYFSIALVILRGTLL